MDSASNLIKVEDAKFVQRGNNVHSERGKRTGLPTPQKPPKQNHQDTIYENYPPRSHAH